MGLHAHQTCFELQQREHVFRNFYKFHLDNAGSDVLSCNGLAACADEVRKERKKATKHDAAHRLASVLHADGKDGVEAEFEKSQAFHDAWRVKSQDMLARAAFRRKKLVQRLQVSMQLSHEKQGASSQLSLKSMCAPVIADVSDRNVS